MNNVVNKLNILKQVLLKIEGERIVLDSMGIGVPIPSRVEQSHLCDNDICQRFDETLELQLDNNVRKGSLQKKRKKKDGIFHTWV